MKATKYIFRWHHWCGLIVGVFLLMMSLTGSMLVFSNEWEKLEEREIPAVQVVEGKPSFDASFKKVQAAHKGWEIRLYHLPKADEALVYDLRIKEERRKVYVHPVTGQVLGQNENANRSVQRSLLLWHYTLFAGTTGKVTVFCTGVLFLITLVTGLIVYRKALGKVLMFRVRINRKTQRSFYSSLHRIIGVWALIFNLLIVVSGLWLSSQIVRTAVKAPLSKSATKKETASIRSIDALVEKLHQEYKDFEIHLIRIRPGSGTVEVSGRLTTDPSYYGDYYSGFTVNGSTLEIEKSRFMKDLPAGERLTKMAAPLHFGNYGGMVLKIVYSLLGLTPAFLSISGFILWKKRKVKRMH